MAVATLIDLDGVLVDSTYHRVLAWYRAFHRHGLIVPAADIHRHIGLAEAGLLDTLVEVTGQVSREDIRATQAEFFRRTVAEIEPLPEAAELIADLTALGHVVMVHSFAGEAEIRHLLDRIAPDLDVQVVSGEEHGIDPLGDSMRELGATSANAIIGTPAACIAAARAGALPIAVLTAGCARDELQESGAMHVFTALASLRRWLGIDDGRARSMSRGSVVPTA
jgi:beta-phosphoglucomutase-like phosphatase (HAD superfamily)